MENSSKRRRPSFADLIDLRYSSRQKENEIKLFENIKTDISMIISEQLKKRSKTEFELTTIEKKFVYLKCVADELEKLLRQGNVELKSEEEMIKNYFEYTTTNLDYIFIKYESIITDLSEKNNDMKLKLKQIKEKELEEFQSSYQLLREKSKKLNDMKNNIIIIKNNLSNLKDEYEHVQKEIEIKKEEKIVIEKSYKELLTNIDGYKKEFEHVKDKCNFQMNEKKQSSINLNIIENKINDMNMEIQNLCTSQKNITNELNNLEEGNREVLDKMIEINSSLNEKCDNLSLQICEIEKEILNMQNENESIHNNYTNLEIKLKEITEMCEDKKKEDEQISIIVKNVSNELIEKKNYLKEIEKESSLLRDEYNFVKNENAQLLDTYNLVEKKIEHVSASISEYQTSIQMRLKELTNAEDMRKQNEKTKVELLNLIENAEKLLLDQKNFFFKISKFFNLISLSNEELVAVQNERNIEMDNNVLQNYEEVQTLFNSLSDDIKEKCTQHKMLQNEIDNFTEEVKKWEAEIKSSEQGHKNLQDKLQNVLNDKDKYENEIKDRKHISTLKIKETTDMLELKYQELTETIATQLKTKHVEHNNFLKQGEKEKLELNFQLFKSEIVASLEKEKDEKKKLIIDRESELKMFQQKYSSLKAV
ncbi:conserved Plasmodium protein, unknown function [Plasmodium ovale wallikeri]|uniref:Uncharacterized protein n=2 Tax=Plasmodium ovale TaxID=36330 RepID=A0A1A9A4B3_PLAOA|nr:conserved Plasmodium protein, unknown function [Plasmodium ovale wallikeri]SBT50950.1 conserved Plasmodium protein, unknown function [Plasmodium ovale wallikeri]SBT82820.1 conserved Plasmodium protein, unknown function [Plasmodium ovale]